MDRPVLSVIAPVYNEEDGLELFYQRTRLVLADLSCSWELIFIDDGSRDSTLSIIKRIRSNEDRVKLISFSRNFGHQAAVIAGIRYSRGAYVAVIDADLQDPPEFLAKMLEACRSGIDVSYGIRRHRKEGWLKRACYKVFYLLLNKISPLRIPRDAGDFCVMSRRIVDVLKTIDEDHPYVRGLRVWAGFKHAGIEYDRASRQAGAPKYTFLGLFGLAIDGILSFSSLALRMAMVLGVIVALLSTAYAAYIGISRIMIAYGFLQSTHLIPGWATIACSIMFFMGLQFIFLGIIGEYVGRAFMQTKHRPLFVVEEEHGF